MVFTTSKEAEEVLTLQQQNSDEEESRLYRLFALLVGFEADDAPFSVQPDGQHEEAQEEHQQVPHQILGEDVSDDEVHAEAFDPSFFVLRVSTEMLASITENKASCAVLKWKHKLPENTKVCFMESCRDGKIVANAVLEKIDAIQTFLELRAHSAFQHASQLQKQSYHNYVAKDKKSLYVWHFGQVQKLVVPFKMKPFRGRSMWVRMSELKPLESKPMPGLDLQETCEYFINRLSSTDRTRLQECVQKLDGKVIRVGSTCSGTDICVNIVKATFKKLSEMFGVPWTCASKYAFVDFKGLYIYIYRFCADRICVFV